MSGVDTLVKYLNWGSPVAAGWGAAQVWERNALIGTILIVYVIVWVFANIAALLVLTQRSWGEFRENLKKAKKGEPQDATISKETETKDGPR